MKNNLILIVEDDKMLSRAYVDHFQRAGYKVLSASDGEDGLAKLKESKPDLLLLDIIMPKMDGIAMLKAIKEDDEIKDTPAIVLTNLDTKKEVARAIEAGGSAYLVKVNYSLEQLEAKVREVLKTNVSKSDFKT